MRGKKLKFATIRTGNATAVVKIDEGTATEIPGFADLGQLLASGIENAAVGGGPPHLSSELDYAPLILRPSKIICVGLNYVHHIQEMGRELPEYPTLFAKYPEALIGANDPIEAPGDRTAIDWEGELAIVIGRTVRSATEHEAEAAIAGYTILNDITARDYQYRTSQWFQGKTWEKTTPLGPVMVTPDELPTDALLTTTINDEQYQISPINDLVFSPVHLIRYISEIFTLQPGDVIATGTPGGVGHAMEPPRHLQIGDRVVTSIGGIGECRNTVIER